MSIKVEIKDNIDLIKYGDRITEILDGGIDNAILNIFSNAVSDAPLGKTGRLKTTARKFYQNLSGEVRFPVHYAPYVEFGTGGLVDVPEGLEDYAIQFIGKGIRQVNLPPRPFLMPNYYRESRQLLNNLAAAIDKLK